MEWIDSMIFMHTTWVNENYPIHKEFLSFRKPWVEEIGDKGQETGREAPACFRST